MKFEYSYSSKEERELLIAQNSDKFLTEEKNITTGNFLIFTDEKPLESEIAIVQEDITAIAETTATLTEDSTATAETLAQALLEIENLKADISALKGA